MKNTAVLLALGSLAALSLSACSNQSLRGPASEHKLRDGVSLMQVPEGPVANVTRESDEALACRYAPVLMDEVTGHRRGGNFDRPIHLLYDVSQTDSHVFITYSVIKPWSEFPLVGNKSNAQHALDTEDILVVLRKNPNRRSELIPVLFSTNAHGNRADYSHPRSDFDHTESQQMDQNRLLLEGKYSAGGIASLFTPVSTFEGIRNRASVTKEVESGASFPSTWLNDRPVTQSRAFDHALLGGSVQTLKNHGRHLAQNGVEVSMAACADDIETSTQLKDSGNLVRSEHRGYQLLPVSEIYQTMTYRSDTLKHSPQAQNHCKSQRVWLNGREVDTPEYPIFADAHWYLSTYDQASRSRLEREFTGSKYDKIMYGHLIPLHFSQDSDKVSDCPRVSPAHFFKDKYPKTWKRHRGSEQYTRFEALNTVPASRP